MGNGIPPAWIQDAAGAELWAVSVVLRLSSFMPYIITDCLGVLEGFRAGSAVMTGPKMKMARVWNIIAGYVDFDMQTASQMITWMPSHAAASSIGHIRCSTGALVTPIMWRANRLVASLAKLAAATTRLPTWFTGKIDTYARMV